MPNDNTTLPVGSGGDTIRTVDRTAAKTQVVQLDWGGDTGAGNEQLGTQTNAYPMGLAATYFFSSLNNSSSVQLAAGATFTGTIETILNQPLASIDMTCDQPMLVTINQSIDAVGTYQLKPIVWNVPAGYTVNRGITINGNYFWISVKNQGSATTTTFDLNVAYGNETPVTENGNIPVEQKGLQSQINSSFIPLAAGALFSGSAEAVIDYSNISIQAYSDQSGTLTYYWSTDALHWDDGVSYKLVGGTNLNIETSPQAPYFYLVFQNGQTAQTVFRMASIYQMSSASGDVISLDQPIVPTQNAQLTIGTLFDSVTPANQMRINGANTPPSVLDPAIVVGISQNSAPHTVIVSDEILRQILVTLQCIQLQMADAFGKHVQPNEVPDFLN